MISLKSFSLKSGHNLSIKNISVYASCHNRKLLNRFVPPVLIKISGSGISRVYSSFSKLFISQAQRPAQFPSQVFLADWRKLR